MSILSEEGSGTYVLSMKELVRRSVPVDYDYAKGPSARTYSIDYRESRVLVQLEALRDAIASRTNAVSACHDYLQKHCGMDETQARERLGHYVGTVVHEILRSGAVDVFHHAIDFKERIEGTPRMVTLTSLVEGVRLPPDVMRYELLPGITLRQPTPPDLTWETPVEYGLSLDSEWWRVDAVLEISRKARDVSEVQRDQDVVLDVLRLLGPTSVGTLKTSITGSGFEFGGTLYGPPRHGSVTMTLSRADADRFVRLYNEAGPAIREHARAGGHNVNPYEIALQRYRDALIAPLPYEGRIAAAVTSMEAVLLRGEERAELAHRLAQRAAAMIQRSGASGLRAYEELTRAYNVRSCYVHGSPLEGEQRKNAQKLSENTAEYARIVLANMLLAAVKGLGKDDIIAKLDRSLLDATTRERLEAALPPPFA